MRIGARLLAAAIAALAAVSARAQTPEGVKVGAALDLNYLYNFNQPAPVTLSADGSPPAGQNRYRVFDLYHDQFSVQLAELSLQKTQGPLTVFASLDFGHMAETLSPKDEVSKNFAQAYLTYQPAPAWTLTAGKTYTHLGGEVAKTRDNWNYSRSWLFGYSLPFWHTGISAQYRWVPEKLSTSVYVYNETAGLYETNRGKTFGLQARWTPSDQTTLVYNNLAGPESGSDGVTRVRQLHELVAQQNLSPKIEAATDLIFGQLTRAKSTGRAAQWLAWTGSLRWRFAPSWYFSPRVEVYSDRSGASVVNPISDRPPLPQRLDAVTLTAGYDLGQGLETRFELRRDHSSQPAFVREVDQASATQTTATVALLWDL